MLVRSYVNVSEEEKRGRDRTKPGVRREAQMVRKVSCSHGRIKKGAEEQRKDFSW